MKFGKITETLLPGTLPDGDYEARMHGYGITFKVNGRNITVETDYGLRGWADGVLTIFGDTMNWKASGE